MQFSYDTYALAKSTGTETLKQGGDTWFFVTADYAFGQALERDTTKFVEQGGGKVLGSVRAPLGTTDYSSFLLQAQASKAKIIGLATAGGDTITAIKQAAEFGIQRGGQRLGGTSDLHQRRRGARPERRPRAECLTTSFYWDLTDETRAWTKRFPGPHGRASGRPTCCKRASIPASFTICKAVQGRRYGRGQGGLEEDARAAGRRLPQQERRSCGRTAASCTTCTWCR